METIAGPGFCATGARRDESSSDVAATAVDAAGRLFFDTGSETAAIVAKVEPDGRATRLVTARPRPARRQAATRPAGASRLAADGDGGVLLAVGSQVVRVAANNSLSVVAGVPATASRARPLGAVPAGRRLERLGVDRGDGGPATAARLAGVWSVATDAAANLFLADVIDAALGTVRIRFVNRGIDPVTFYPATPHQLVVAPGAIATVAGASGRVGGGDGGPARAAVLQGVPPAMAVAGERLYVASSWAPPGLSSEETAGVRLINLGGNALTAHGVTVGPGGIDTVAGGGRVGERGDGGAARSAAFTRLPGVAADAHGNLFLADELNNRVRRVDATGVVTTVVGRPGTGGQNAGFNGNDRPATDALLHQPFDVEAGPGERLYVSDRRNRQVRVVDRGGTIRAAPGSGVALTWVCDHRGDGAGTPPPRQVPQPGSPSSVVADARGNVYIANADGQQVVRRDRAGAVTTVVGSRRGDRGCLKERDCPVLGDGGPAVNAELVRPTALELTPGGHGLYVFDTVRVRVVNLGNSPLNVHGRTVAAGAIETVAGNGAPGAAGDGGEAVAAELGSVENQDFAQAALAADRHGNLFVGDPFNRRVRQVDRFGVISTFAGTSAPGPRGACCTDPVGVATDGAGNLYVADLGRDGVARPHPRVWFVNRSMRPVTALGVQVEPGAASVVAGTGRQTLIFDGEGGPALEASLLPPVGITLDRRGALYLTGVGMQEVDRNAQLVGGEGEVRKVDPSGVITWVMGNGQSGFNGDGLKPRLTSLNSPSDVAFDACGNLLVADQGNDRVRRLNIVRCRPNSATAAARTRAGDRETGGAGGVPTALIAGAAVAVALVVLGRSRRRRLGAGDSG